MNVILFQESVLPLLAMSQAMASLSTLAVLCVPLLLYACNDKLAVHVSCVVVLVALKMIFEVYQQPSESLIDDPVRFRPWTMSFTILVHGSFIVAKKINLSYNLMGIGMMIVSLWVMKQDNIDSLESLTIDLFEQETTSNRAAP